MSHKADPLVGADGLCNSKTKQGNGRCRKTAGWGTPHPGAGACRLHGGNMENHLLRHAPGMAQALGGPIEIEPHDALLYCVRRAAGDVAFFEAQIAALNEAALIASPLSTLHRSADGEVTEEERRAPVELNVWIRARDHALERLARFAKMAIDAGIEERRVRNAERAGDLLAALAEAMFEALGTAPRDRARVLPIVEGRLLQLEQRPGEAA